MIMAMILKMKIKYQNHLNKKMMIMEKMDLKYMMMIRLQELLLKIKKSNYRNKLKF